MIGYHIKHEYGMLILLLPTT